MAKLKHEQWLNYARGLGATKSNCQKAKYGAVIVRGNKILVWGWNHTYNDKPCNPCLRISVKSGTRYEICKSIHAEQAALLAALNSRIDISKATMYVAGLYSDGSGGWKPVDNPRLSCTICARLLSQTKLRGIVVSTAKGPLFKTLQQALEDSYDWVKDEN